VSDCNVLCFILRPLDGGLGIRWCVPYVNTIIPCNFIVLLEGNVISAVSALIVSALVFLTQEYHGSEEEEEESPRSCQIKRASEGGCLQCALLQYVLLVAMYGWRVHVQICTICLPTPSPTPSFPHPLQKSIHSFAGGRLTFLKRGSTSASFNGCVWNFVLKARIAKSIHAFQCDREF